MASGLMEPRCSFVVIKITNKYSSTRWDNGIMLNVKKKLHGSTYNCSRLLAGCEAIASAKALQTLERYMYKTCKSKKILKPTRRITNHTHGSSLRCRFFMAPLARSSSRCVLRRSFLAAALPPLAIYRYIPPTSQLVQPVGTQTGDAPQRHGSI